MVESLLLLSYKHWKAPFAYVLDYVLKVIGNNIGPFYLVVSFLAINFRVLLIQINHMIGRNFGLLA